MDYKGINEQVRKLRLEDMPKQDSNGHAEERPTIFTALNSLTNAVNNLSEKIDTFMELHTKSVPYPIVILIFIVLIAALFGVGAVAVMLPGVPPH